MMKQIHCYTLDITWKQGINYNGHPSKIWLNACGLTFLYKQKLRKQFIIASHLHPKYNCLLQLNLVFDSLILQLFNILINISLENMVSILVYSIPLNSTFDFPNLPFPNFGLSPIYEVEIGLNQVFCRAFAKGFFLRGYNFP